MYFIKIKKNSVRQLDQLLIDLSPNFLRTLSVYYYYSSTLVSTLEYYYSRLVIMDTNFVIPTPTLE